MIDIPPIAAAAGTRAPARSRRDGAAFPDVLSAAMRTEPQRHADRDTAAKSPAGVNGESAGTPDETPDSNTAADAADAVDTGGEDAPDATVDTTADPAGPDAHVAAVPLHAAVTRPATGGGAPTPSATAGSPASGTGTTQDGAPAAPGGTGAEAAPGDVAPAVSRDGVATEDGAAPATSTVASPTRKEASEGTGTAPAAGAQPDDAATPAVAGPKENVASGSVPFPGSSQADGVAASGGDQPDGLPTARVPQSASVPTDGPTATAGQASMAPADAAHGSDGAAGPVATASRNGPVSTTLSDPSGTKADPAAASAPATSTAPGPSGASPAPAPAPVAGTALQRVVDALETLRNAPPPRSLTLDLPDLEGLRLHLSLRGQEVRIAVMQDASGTWTPGLERDLDDALASRGFDLHGDGREGRNEDKRRQRPSNAHRARHQSPQRSGLRL